MQHCPALQSPYLLLPPASPPPSQSPTQPTKRDGIAHCARLCSKRTYNTIVVFHVLLHFCLHVRLRCKQLATDNCSQVFANRRWWRSYRQNSRYFWGISHVIVAIWGCLQPSGLPDTVASWVLIRFKVLACSKFHKNNGLKYSSLMQFFKTTTFEFPLLP